MKKATQLTTIAAIAVLFAACKKDYTCTCTVSDPTGAPHVTRTTLHNTKQKAEAACKDMESSSANSIYYFNGVSVATVAGNCHI